MISLHPNWFPGGNAGVVPLSLLLTAAGCASCLPVPATQCSSKSDCAAPRECVDGACRDPAESSSSGGAVTSSSREAASGASTSAGASALPGTSSAPSSGLGSTSSLAQPSSSTSGASLPAASSLGGSGGGINGACGTANDALATVSATDGEPGSMLTLCSAGPGVQSPPTPVVNPGISYAWTCPGSGQGASAGCQSYLGWDVTLTTGPNGTLSCTRENPPSGAAATIMVAASTSSTRKVWHNHLLTCTATPAVGYAASLFASGPGCGGASGGTVGPFVGAGGCTVTANFQAQGPMDGCPAAPANFAVQTYPNYSNTNAVLIQSIPPSQGVAFQFVIDTAAYPNGYLISNTGSSGQTWISLCPGQDWALASSYPLNQGPVGSTSDPNGDGILNSCAYTQTYIRYQHTETNPATYYDNATNLAANTCFLPTTTSLGGSTPATYFFNVLNTSVSQPQLIQNQNIAQ